MKFFNKTMLLLALTAVSSQVFAADAGQKLAADKEAFNKLDHLYSKLQQKKDITTFTAADLKDLKDALKLKALNESNDPLIKDLLKAIKENFAKEIPAIKALKDEFAKTKLGFPEDLDLDKGLTLNYAIAGNHLPLAKLLVAYGANVPDPNALVGWITSTYSKDPKKFAEYADMIAWVKTLKKTA